MCNHQRTLWTLYLLWNNWQIFNARYLLVFHYRHRFLLSYQIRCLINQSWLSGHRWRITATSAAKHGSHWLRFSYQSCPFTSAGEPFTEPVVLLSTFYFGHQTRCKQRFQTFPPIRHFITLQSWHQTRVQCLRVMVIFVIFFVRFNSMHMKLAN